MDSTAKRHRREQAVLLVFDLALTLHAGAGYLGSGVRPKHLSRHRATGLTGDDHIEDGDGEKRYGKADRDVEECAF